MRPYIGTPLSGIQRAQNFLNFVTSCQRNTLVSHSTTTNLDLPTQPLSKHHLLLWVLLIQLCWRHNHNKEFFMILILCTTIQQLHPFLLSIPMLFHQFIKGHKYCIQRVIMDKLYQYQHNPVQILQLIWFRYIQFNDKQTQLMNIMRRWMDNSNILHVHNHGTTLWL